MASGWSGDTYDETEGEPCGWRCSAVPGCLASMTDSNNGFPAVHLVMNGASFMLDDESFSFSVQSKSLAGVERSPKEASRNESVLKEEGKNISGLLLCLPCSCQ